MERSTLNIMVLFAVLSVATVCILSSLASTHQKGNGFTRKFAAHKVLATADTLDVKFDSYYIAGNTDHHLYLGNIVAPRHLLALNIHTLDTQHVELQLHNLNKLTFSQVRIKVDSPFFYMTDGSVPAIFKGALHDRQAYLIKEPGVYFLDIEPISETSFAIRSLVDKEAKIGKITHKPFGVNFPAGILQRQIDGIFCTEGAIHCDKQNAKLTYVYLYRNQYIVMDTSLNILYKRNTIDTTSIARIKVATIMSKSTNTLSVPPSEVNRVSVVNGNRLFINSALQADNEQYKKFKKNSVIDVYDLNDGRYINSFYIPDYSGNKLRNFRVSEKKLAALYDRHIVIYDLKLIDLDDNTPL